MQTRDQYATPACPKQLAAAFLTAFEVIVAPETIASFKFILLPFYFAPYAPTFPENAPNFRLPFDLALCIKISVGSQKSLTDQAL